MKSALLSIGTLVFGVVSLATSTVADAAWYETYDFSSKGVAGYWPLDGNANDVTGNGNDGTVHEAVLTTGKLGQGYDFDGADDRIQINNSLMNGFSAVTMACWMKADSFDTNTSHLIVKAGQDGQFGPAYLGVTAQDDYPFHAVSTGSNDSQAVLDNLAVATATWYHMAGTYDGTTLRLYVNGVQVSEDAKSPAGNLVSNSEILFIGSNDNYGFDSSFDGIIDDAVIFNRALSAAEVAALASDDNANGVSDYWEFPWYNQYFLTQQSIDLDGMPDAWENAH